MDKIKILDFLKENGLTEAEEIGYKDDIFVVNFFYDFDEEEIKSAKAYSNDESEETAESEVWYEEFFLPYLNDLAVDNVGEVIEEIMEKFNIDGQYVSYEMDEEAHDCNEFVAIFHEKGKEVNIEKIIEELNL
jgi:hypothetical protein